MLFGKLFHIRGPCDLNDPLCTSSVRDQHVYSTLLFIDLRVWL